MKIFKVFWRIIKFYYIIPLFIFILTNSFDLILKFILITFSIQNIFHFPLFFIIDNN